MDFFEKRVERASALARDLFLAVANEFAECVMGFGCISDEPGGGQEQFHVRKFFTTITAQKSEERREQELYRVHLAQCVRAELRSRAEDPRRCFHNHLASVRYTTDQEVLLVVCEQLFPGLALAFAFLALCALRFPITCLGHVRERGRRTWNIKIERSAQHDVIAMFRNLFEKNLPKEFSVLDPEAEHDQFELFSVRDEVNNDFCDFAFHLG